VPARAQDRYADAARAHQAALPLARAAGQRGEEALALLGLAYAAMFTGNAPVAGARAAESLAVARAAQDRPLLARALFFMGWITSNGGMFEASEPFVTESLDLFEALGDTGEQSETLFVLGTNALFAGDYERAAAFFERSLALRRGRGDEQPLARHPGGLATALLNSGDLVRARVALDESLVVARQFDDRWSSSMSLVILGRVDLAEDDAGRAQGRLAEAAALFQATGNMVYLPWCLEGLASAAAAQGRHERAAELDGAREALRAQIGVFLPPMHPAGYARTLAAIRTPWSRRLRRRPAPGRPVSRRRRSSRWRPASRTRSPPSRLTRRSSGGRPSATPSRSPRHGRGSTARSRPPPRRPPGWRPGPRRSGRHPRRDGCAPARSCARPAGAPRR
jgi:tetratricopeptide (TPR) repeat protein